MQNMSMIPIGLALEAARPFGHEDPFSGSTGWVARYGTQEVSQFRGAELIAEKWNISREEMEAFAFTSHERAIVAIDISSGEKYGFTTWISLGNHALYPFTSKD